MYVCYLSKCIHAYICSFIHTCYFVKLLPLAALKVYVYHFAGPATEWRIFRQFKLQLVTEAIGKIICKAISHAWRMLTVMGWGFTGLCLFIDVAGSVAGNGTFNSMTPLQNCPHFTTILYFTGRYFDSKITDIINHHWPMRGLVVCSVPNEYQPLNWHIYDYN